MEVLILDINTHMNIYPNGVHSLKPQIYHILPLLYPNEEDSLKPQINHNIPIKYLNREHSLRAWRYCFTVYSKS